MRTLAVLAVLLLAGLAGCLQGSTPTTSLPAKPDPAKYVVPAVPKVDAAALLSDLKSFAVAYPQRRDNLPTHEGARAAIAKAFADDGLTVWRQNFTKGGLRQTNVVGVHWGAVRDQWVVVGGHYDDCLVGSTPSAGPVPREPNPARCATDSQSQGAYDDGSGTMMVLHLAQAWAHVPSYYTIAFVAYDGEERGTQGAQTFAEEMLTGNTTFGEVRFHAALDIDMFGITWPGSNAPTQILDNSNALHKVFDDTRRAIGMPDSMVYCQDMVTLGSSDFQVYFNLNVSTAFFSSDFGKVAPPGSPAPLPMAAYPNWHLVDTYATMEAEAGGATALQQGFTTAATIAAAELHAMADQPTLVLDVHTPAHSTGVVDTQSCA
jgi:Zn-dependent M28 family amino/carboxypeptidase